jgi:hypothetical protein
MGKFIYLALGVAVGAVGATIVHAQFKEKIHTLVEDVQRRADDLIAKMENSN